MGLFKQMKEMKNVVAAAPAMMQQGQALAASAQAMQAAQMGQMQQAIAYNQQVGQPIAPEHLTAINGVCLLYTSPSPRDRTRSRMPSSA